MGTRSVIVGIVAVVVIGAAGTLAWMVKAQQQTEARYAQLADYREQLRVAEQQFATTQCDEAARILLRLQNHERAGDAAVQQELEDLKVAYRKRMGECVTLKAREVRVLLQQAASASDLTEAIAKAREVQRKFYVQVDSLPEVTSAAIAAIDAEFALAEDKMVELKAQELQREINAKRALDAETRAKLVAKQEAEAAAQAAKHKQFLRENPDASLLEFSQDLQKKIDTYYYSDDCFRDHEGLLTISDVQLKQTDSVVAPVQGHIVGRYQHIMFGVYEVVWIVVPSDDDAMWKDHSLSARYMGDYPGGKYQTRPSNASALEKVEQLVKSARQHSEKK